MTGRTQARQGAPRVLHLHASLAADRPLAERCVRIMAAFGGRLRHTLVSADGAWTALDALPPGVPVERREAFPPLTGAPTPGRLQRLVQAMGDYHLVCTYGRGATDAALAHTAFGQVHRPPPLIHHEDGSDETARDRAGLRSRWARRIGLGSASGLVVPSETMEEVALEGWQQPLGRVKLIPDGVDLALLARAARADAIPRLVKRPGELWIGCDLGPAGANGNGALARSADLVERLVDGLLDGLAALDPRWHLVLLGEAAVSDGIAARISARSQEPRVHTLRALRDPLLLTRLSDLVAVAPGAEPLPRAAVLALGAGRAVLGFAHGDLPAALAPVNAPFIAPAGDRGALATALAGLAAEGDQRQAIASANRALAEADRGEEAMIATYRRLYASAMGRDTF